MITQLRKKIKSRLFHVIVWITIALMILPLSITELIRFIVSGKSWVISVNGDKILPEEITQKVQEHEYQIKAIHQQYPEFADAYIQLMGLNRDPKDLAIDSLVKQTLLNQAVVKLGLPISSIAVAEQFADIDPRLLQMRLQQMRISATEFENQIKSEMGRAMLNDIIGRAYYVPDFVLKEHYVTNYLGKKFSFVPFKLSDFIKNEEAIAISPEDVKNYFDEQNKRSKKYYVPEKRSGIVWKFDPSHYGISISSDDIARYYEAHKTEYKEKPAQVSVRRILLQTTPETDAQVYEKAKEIREELLKNPESFAQKAKEVSQDKESAKEGGLLVPFSQGTYDREFEKAAFLLQKKNDISNVVKTSAGYEIIQLIEKKQPVFKQLSSVENDIRSHLVQQKFNEKFLADTKVLIEQAKVNPQVLEQFVADKKAKKIIVTDIGVDNTIITQALFRLQPNGIVSLKEGDLGVIVRLTGTEKAHFPTLAQVEDVVKKDFIKSRAQRKLHAALEKAKEDAKSKSLAEFNKLFEGRVEHTSVIKPSDSEAIKKLKERGISILDLFQIEKPGASIVSRDGENGYLIRLDEVEPFNQEAFNTHKEELLASAQDQESRAIFEGFVASLYRNATIKQN